MQFFSLPAPDSIIFQKPGKPAPSGCDLLGKYNYELYFNLILIHLFNM